MLAIPEHYFHGSENMASISSKPQESPFLLHLFWGCSKAMCMLAEAHCLISLRIIFIL